MTTVPTTDARGVVHPTATLPPPTNRISVTDDLLMGPKPMATWGCVELMGRVSLTGYVTEEQRFGATLGRVDIPQLDANGEWELGQGGEPVFAS